MSNGGGDGAAAVADEADDDAIRVSSTSESQPD